jgi:catechol 2,3-dioxygenase-like lactoylglutathione lyase family enzyme
VKSNKSKAKREEQGVESEEVVQKAHFILYVKDQYASARFYSDVLGRKPKLHVPGMTEFELGKECVLGLMPEAGIKRLLGPSLPDPALSKAVPRAELYLVVEDAATCQSRALGAGAREMSPLSLMDWGHKAAYSLDPDGHVLAFAEKASS